MRKLDCSVMHVLHPLLILLGCVAAGIACQKAPSTPGEVSADKPALAAKPPQPPEVAPPPSRLEAGAPLDVAGVTYGMDETLKPGTLFVLKEPTPQNIAGVYGFGHTEMEWRLRVIPLGNEVVTQKVSATLICPGDNCTSPQAAWEYQSDAKPASFRDGRMAGGSFPGRFVLWSDDDGKTDVALLLDKRKYLGARTHDLQKEYSGAYPQASIRLLEVGDLKTLSPLELTVMRNEIFARYGHVFKAGGAMAKHFANESWYKPLPGSFDTTFIEKENVRRIRAQEDRINNE